MRNLLVILLLVAGAGAARAASCGDRAAECEAACTPERATRYYSSSLVRCTASCEPRRQQCLRTGEWVHLEDRYPGWREQVD